MYTDYRRCHALIEVMEMEMTIIMSKRSKFDCRGARPGEETLAFIYIISHHSGDVRADKCDGLRWRPAGRVWCVGRRNTPALCLRNLLTT